MKTQLHRMKQRAAQTVGRAEKTELLTENLQSVEKIVEKVKTACTLTSKKLNACTISNGPDLEKRKKKLPQLHLGQGMLDSAVDLGERSLLGGVMFKAGEAQGAIAGELATYETELDEEVLAPLHELTEVLIPNISLTKKKLSTAQLDMDSAKARWQSAQKIAQHSNNHANKTELLAKANLLQSDYEDQSLLFQHTQDQLATDMMTFVAGERKYAQWIFKMLEAQMRYHQASLDILKDCVPCVDERIEDDVYRPTYGCPLDIHLRNTRREIATVIEDCVLFLYNNALDMQGLFRLAGSASKVKKLKAALDVGIADLDDYICDVHAVTGALKLYLRELPEPLLTFNLYEEWIHASKIKETDAQVIRIKELVDLLPKANKDNLRFLICFLAKLAEHKEENKMGPSNIAIVIGPNVLWDSNDGGVNVKTTGNISIIVETLIENCSYMFPEGCDFTQHSTVDGEVPLHTRFDSVDGELREELGSPEHSGLGHIYNDMFKKKKDKKDNSLERKNGHSKEDLHSVEGNGGGSNHYSDMFKKLNKDKKDGNHHCAAEAVPGGGLQGYYNPISATLDDSLTTTTATAEVSSTTPHNNDNNPPYTNHRKQLSNAEAPTAMMERDDHQTSPSHHNRSISAGNITDMDVKRTTTTTTTTPGKDKMRRPAPPPPPKHPPMVPPKTKPPEPPKHKPPEPPCKPPPMPPTVVPAEEEGS